ncbi:MAG TPA: hypothetical protein VF541_05695 [Longimicrobium sp.]
MSTHPQEQAADSVPFHSRPKAERDAILRDVGIRPAASEEPRRAFEPLRSRPMLRAWWHRIFPHGLYIPRPRFLRRRRRRSRVPSAPPVSADTRPWHTRPKEERDAILRAAGIEPARIGGPLPYLKPVRTRMTLRMLWRRIFAG